MRSIVSRTTAAVLLATLTVALAIIKYLDNYVERALLSDEGVLLYENMTFIRDLHNKLSWGLLGLALVATLVAFIVSVLNTKSLRRLNELSTQLINGAFDQHFEVEGPKEVVALSQVLEQVRLRFRQLVSGAITRAMIWEGNLSLFPLSQLLMMLRFTSQTGVLIILVNSSVGRIYVENGQIQGARFDDLQGFRAFYSMFLLRDGAFRFNQQMKPFNDELQTYSWYSILLYAARRVNSLEFIEQYVPDLRFVAHRGDLGPEERQVQKDLTPEEWELFQSIDGQQNVRQLARQLQWTEQRVQRYLYRFAVIGLIETQFSSLAAKPPQNVVSLWTRVAWRDRN